MPSMLDRGDAKEALEIVVEKITTRAEKRKHEAAIKRSAELEAAARADQRWGLNSVEVFNTNNRTTVGSANNTSLTLEISPQR